MSQSDRQPGAWARCGRWAAAAVVACVAAGCATPRVQPMQARFYQIEVALDPAAHRLAGQCEMTLKRSDTAGSASADAGPAAIDLLLHPDLEITAVQAGGAQVVRFGPSAYAAPGDEEGFTPRRYSVVLDRPVEACTLTVDYAGRLWQDISAGERPGEIHNFAVRAHVGEEGVYLERGWYPRPWRGDPEPPEAAEYRLTAVRVPDMELAASGERETIADDTRQAWVSPYPLDGMVLVGGRHEVHEMQHGDVTIRAHLKPQQAEQARPLMETIAALMDRYEPLVGPYPAREYTVVDNFFSSGFAFPTFTLLSSAVIDMGDRARTTHGYLDHELLHCWWGNGVLVDPWDGNWCEALASYAANYYGYVLDGDEEEARRKRRNFTHFVSRLEPQEDKALGTFGLPDGCGRTIAYSKGAMVFHMLARQMGEENFWAAMRTLDSEYLGRHASWGDIQRVCEETCGRELDIFFTQWVRRGGAPTLSIESARYDSADQRLRVRLAQEGSGFVVDVPVRVTHAEGELDLTVPLWHAVDEAVFRVEATPLSVELDPDYHVFRRVPAEHILPTTAATRGTERIAVILPEGDTAAYDGVVEAFTSKFADDDVLTLRAGTFDPDDLAGRSVLICGPAVRDDWAAALLSEAWCPVSFSEGRFTFDGVTYAGAAEAVLCTVPHPQVAGGGISVVYGNTAEALPNGFNLLMYEHSLLVFRDQRPVVRRDLEYREVVEVERE